MVTLMTLVVSVLVLSRPARAEPDNLKTAAEINQELDALNQRFQELQKQAAEYATALNQTRTKARTLDNQVSWLKSKTRQTQNTIDTLTVEIQRLRLEETKTRLLIEDRSLDMQEALTTLESMLQNFAVLQKRGGWLALFEYRSLGEYFSAQVTLYQMQRELARRVTEIRTLKDYLQQERANLQTQQVTQDAKRTALAIEREELREQQTSTTALLQQTKNSESRYQELVNELQAEQEAADKDIKRLEILLREKLRQDQIIRLGQAVFTWPVPNRKITTEFFDPAYPFRYLFEHPGIDIRASHGSTIFAPANGIVAKVRNNGFGYSYLVLLHGDNFTTVYGHVSGFLVKEGDFVLRGQGIALVGGTPGTRGAGPLTTGPHLHFELRKNGTPINPLPYLP